MTLASKLVAGAMLLVIVGAPAMACLVPDAQLTEEEKACCRHMAHQCGSMDMASGHSCCQKVVQHHNPAIVKDAIRAPVPQLSAQVAAIEPVASTLAALVSPRFERPRHPPPDPAGPSIEILRI